MKPVPIDAEEFFKGEFPLGILFNEDTPRDVVLGLREFIWRHVQDRNNLNLTGLDEYLFDLQTKNYGRDIRDNARKGGQSRSLAKTQAVRQNAKLGGRPKGYSPKTTKAPSKPV